MALKIELRSGECLLVRDCLITNDGPRTRLVMQGEVAILREKDIMVPDRADTPVKRIYLAIQSMYMSGDPKQYHPTYFSLIQEVRQTAPSTLVYIDNINEHILQGEYYKALKVTQKLIAYEQELLTHAKRVHRDSAGGEHRGATVIEPPAVELALPSVR